MLDQQQVSDRIEIVDLVTRYTRAVDSGAWDDLDRVFVADAFIDYTSAGGRKGSLPEIKAWLAEVLPHFPRRQHIIGQVAVDLATDSARVSAYFTNPMVHVGADGTEHLMDSGGYYHHELLRTSGGWRSRRLVEETVWTR